MESKERQWIGPEETGDAVRKVDQFGRLRSNHGRLAKTSRIGPWPTRPQNSLRRATRSRLVACDQAGVDRPDRGADHPVRLDPGLVQGLVDACLVGAEGSAALKHQNDLPCIGPSFSRGSGTGMVSAMVTSAISENFSAWFI